MCSKLDDVCVRFIAKEDRLSWRNLEVEFENDTLIPVSSEIQQDSSYHADNVNSALPSTLPSLSDDVLLRIFEYLDAMTLCRLSRVCRSWYILTNDELLWRNLIARDSPLWSSVLSQLEIQTNECLSSKEIYLHNSPLIRNAFCESGSTSLISSLSNVFKKLVRRPVVPKILMFGPGLESRRCKRILRNLVSDFSVDFSVVGLLPSQQSGIGSGVTLRTKYGHIFHLITMYSNYAHARRSIENPWDRLKNSRFFSAADHLNGRENCGDHQKHPSSNLEVIQPIQTLCGQMQAAIFVTESSADAWTQDAAKAAHAELSAFLTQEWFPANIPFLVFCCCQNSEYARIPCLTIALDLALNGLNRHWKAQDVQVEDLHGFAEGFSWLLESISQG